MRYLAPLLYALVAAGCTGVSNAPVPPAAVSGAGLHVAAKQPPHAYWALFANQKPELEVAATPLTRNGTVVRLNGTTGNMLSHTCCIRFRQNFAWVLTAPGGQTEANVLLIFRLPLTPSSVPLYYDTLEGNTFGVHMEFDSIGNLWMSALGPQRNLGTVTEYSGNFLQEGGDFQPALTLTTGLSTPQGIAFDQNGYLYVANAGSNNIAVFSKPFGNEKPYHLTGIENPGGITFDKNGNLFAASNEGSTGAIVEYLKSHLDRGAKPNVVDATGIVGSPYGSDLAFDAAGNLYDADCGSHAGIYTYPLATQQFTSKLKPSFYTNQSILQNGCTWGIALH